MYHMKPTQLLFLIMVSILFLLDSQNSFASYLFF